MERIHLSQGMLWLKAADYIGGLKNSENAKYSVAISMAIHALIKANDALTYKFLNVTARRHDDARRLFEEMIRSGCLDSSFAHHKDTLQDAINSKARAEYKGAYFSKADFLRMQRKAADFVDMVYNRL